MNLFDKCQELQQAVEEEDKEEILRISRDIEEGAKELAEETEEDLRYNQKDRVKELLEKAKENIRLETLIKEGLNENEQKEFWELIKDE